MGGRGVPWCVDRELFMGVVLSFYSEVIVVQRGEVVTSLVWMLVAFWRVHFTVL